MNLINEKILEQVNVRSTTQFLLLSGIAIIMPFYFHLQLVTGPLINAIFILVLFLVGIRSALILCLIPSLMALAGGLLPAVLAPAIPFIMISNAIYVISIEYLFKNSKEEIKGFWTGVIIGSALKFIFLFLSVNIIVKLLVKQELAAKVAQMMSWPQFATAIAGGIIAWFILKFLQRI